MKPVNLFNYNAAMNNKLTMADINALSNADFVRLLGPIFEHSPWIAGATWADRPFPDSKQLLRALCQTVEKAPESKQLALIRAHPDLVDRAALAGTLTPASAREQASAGLDKLSPEDIATFQKLNQAYRTRFDFPFVICARLNKKEAILNGLRARLENSPSQEMRTALEEIFKIADLRLREILE
jgi:OHCU decarboxylase